MKNKIALLIIDPQNDFCDLPKSYLPTSQFSEVALEPQLAVAGAHADMLRLADFMHRGQAGLSNIIVTLDSHHRVGIERPALWKNADGTPMQPFTQIRAADVRAGKYLLRDPRHTERVLAYLDALEAGGRYIHMVWTPHCEIGTWGHNVHADVRAAYIHWEEQNLGVVSKVFKGSNPWTEHYSAVQAEVPVTDDPNTHTNQALLADLKSADLVLIAGEAGSHCVKATTEHIVQNFGPANLSKLVILQDTISPVGGFEAQYADFLKDMAGRGLQLSTTREFLPELLANAAR